MKLLENRVLLLKSEKENSEDKFERSLVQHGFTVDFLKTLEFKFINLDKLETKLNKIEEYEGIIFVTPRTVKGVQESLHSNSNTIQQWNDKSNYVIGATTHELVIKELGLQNCIGQESGNASNLAEIILKSIYDPFIQLQKYIILDKVKIAKPFLYPCGNLKTDTLINKLQDQKLNVDVVVIYETVSSSTLEGDFQKLTDNLSTIPEYWVYFSPSGVKATLYLIELLSDDIRSLIKFIAIGPTTNTALRENNIEVKSVCQKPTPEDLISAILS